VADENGLPDIATWTWQWLLDDTPIAGATSQTYVVQGSDYGGAIKVQASFTDNDGYAEQVTSAATAAVGVDEYLHNFDTATDGGFTHTRASDATVHNHLANIITVTTDVEAYPGGNYVPPWQDESVGYGIQLEESRTNIVASSLPGTAGWTSSGGNSSQGAHATILAPNGQLEAIQYDVSLGSGFTYYKAGEDGDYKTIWLRTVSGTGQAHVLHHNSVAGSLQTITEEWQRFGAPVNRSDTSGDNLYLVDGRGSTDLSTILCWDGQIETGAFPTSNIRTSGSAVIRAATSLSAPFSALSPLPAGGVVNDFCGQVVFVMPADVADIPTGEGYFSLLNEANVTEARLGIHNTSATNLNFGMRDSVGWFDLGNTEYGNLRKGDVADIRFRYSSGGLAFWVNGVKTTAAGRAGFGAPLSTVRVGRNYTGDYASAIKATITRIVPAALTDEEITAWPTWTEPLPIITQQPEDINFGGSQPVEPPKGVIWQNCFDDSAGMVTQHTNAWVTDPDKVPVGFDAIKTKQAEFRIEAGEGTTGQKNALVLDFVDRRVGEAEYQPTIALAKHLTGDQNTGFDEIYVRYRVRLPDGWVAGSPGSEFTQWKWMRAWQNTTPTPSSNWTENREDSYYVVNNWGGSPHSTTPIDINSTWGRPYDPGAGGSNAGPRTVGDWYKGTSSVDHATVRGCFEHVGGNWDINEGPLRRGAWELRKDDGSYQLLNTGQTWHTIEYRIKLAPGQVASEEELTWDAELEVWFDGINQGPFTRYRYGGNGWPPYDGQAAPGISTTRVGSGLNWIGVFDNMQKWNQRWADQEGRIFVDDVVVSTDRIGHEYEVKNNVFNPGMGT
jgi:hypothetical protein